MATASITFTLDADVMQQVVAAFCATYSYRATIPDPANRAKMIPNPQTPTEFAQQQIVNNCKLILRNYLISKEVEATRASATVNAEASVKAAMDKLVVTTS